VVEYQLPLGFGRFGLAIGAVTTVLWAFHARADEPLFGHVYTTDLLPRGKWELAQWATASVNQSQGTYRGYQFREEIEYGVRDNFQLALYANSSYVTANRNGVEGNTSGPGVPENADPSREYSRFRFDSVSVEGIYRILSPYTDSFGLALYLRPSIGPRLFDLESKVIGQKNFLDDTLILAANVTVDQGLGKQTGNPFLPFEETGAHPRWTNASIVEVTAGASYRIAPNWFAGIEFRNDNGFRGSWFNLAEYSAFFLGPSVHYGAERFWATFTIQPQLPLGQPYTEELRATTVGHRIFGNEHTAIEFRLKAGWVF
jgi:hypothetical protein